MPRKSVPRNKYNVYIGQKRLALSTHDKDLAISTSDHLSTIHAYVRMDENDRTVRVLKRTIGELK